MSAPAAGAGGIGRALLIGAGAGCGCLSLIAVALVIVVVIAGVAGRSAPGGGPGPAQRQPGGAAAAGGVQIQVGTVRLDQNRQVVAPSDIFQRGEVIGALVMVVSVLQPVTVNRIIVRWQPGRERQGTPVTEPVSSTLTPEMQGKRDLFTINSTGAEPGRYGILLIVPGAGDQGKVIASHDFQIQ